MAAKATQQELFTLRIPSPSAELSGEVLTRKIPKEWSATSSIYADQYLSHMCPPDLDDEQRRQFFCILDLRRLKYAADEIFSKKDWKLNVVNFAKEFEKSRSIILLRYGLYKFQNVQPSKEVMKRWRRDHGLPDLEDEEGSTPSKTPTKTPSSKKRKAADDSAVSRSKRQAPDEEEKIEAAKAKTKPAEPAPSQPAAKKRAFVEDDDEEPRSKMQKSTPSAAKSLFEKAANKSSTPISTPAKSNLFSAKPTDNLAKSVFSGLKPGAHQAGSGSSNIFGHLSDNSAQNSGVEGDAESETDSDDNEDNQDEPSDVPSGPTETAGNIFAKKPSPDSVNGTRESTPGRSIFERVEKSTNGEAARADLSSTPAKPADQTWNPSTTPLKFAPTASAAPTSNLFGASTAASSTAGSLFGAKPSTTTPSSLFGASKKEEPVQESTTPTTANEKEAGESDKENEAKASKPLFGLPAATSAPSSGLFGSKPAETSEPAAESKPSTPFSFGSDSKPAAPTTSSASSLFGSSNKLAAASSAPQPSPLFGAKPSEPASNPAPADSSKPASLFGAAAAVGPGTSEKPASGLFGNTKPSPNTANIFGQAASSTPTSTLFGAPKTTPSSEAPKTNPTPSTQAPLFSFGATSSATNGATAKPLFEAPKSPPPSSSANLFAGSPMKQDEPSPVKKPFSSGNNGDSTPKFAFGGQNGTTSNLFGATNANVNGTTNANVSFGGSSQASNGGSFNFNFGGGGGSANSSFTNPFTSGSAGQWREDGCKCQYRGLIQLWCCQSS